MKKLLIIAIFSLMFQIVFSQNTINETPILVNKNHVNILENILNISKNDLLKSEVDNGNIYLWVNENQLSSIRANNLKFIKLKIAQSSSINNKLEKPPGYRGVIPELDPPTYSGDPTVGSEITLYLTGRNASYTSWSNDDGYLTMTLPDFCDMNSFLLISLGKSNFIFTSILSTIVSSKSPISFNVVINNLFEFRFINSRSFINSLLSSEVTPSKSFLLIERFSRLDLCSSSSALSWQFSDKSTVFLSSSQLLL